MTVEHNYAKISEYKNTLASFLINFCITYKTYLRNEILFFELGG